MRDVDLAHVHKYRFNLVDLIGSERQASAEAVGMRLKEDSYIGKSLPMLDSVINALVDTS
jgi:hypothetical protein